MFNMQVFNMKVFKVFKVFKLLKRKNGLILEVKRLTCIWLLFQTTVTHNNPDLSRISCAITSIFLTQQPKQNKTKQNKTK